MKLIRNVAMSNAERQRLFQLGHPGYDARRKARERAAGKRAARASIAKRSAAAAAAAEAGPTSEGSQLLLFPAMRRAA
jgi:hypothetical protein